MLVYVDDIVITGSNNSLIQDLIHRLNAQFSLKDLEELYYFLGLHVTRIGKSLHLNQSKYIQDLLVRSSMSDAKPLSSPMSSDRSSSFYS